MTRMSLFTAIIACSATIFSVGANQNWEKLQKNFSRKGGDPKALSHVRCFMERQAYRSFDLKKPDKSYYNARCFNRESVTLENDRYMTIIDYTMKGSKRRMFLLDTHTGDVDAMGVAHGRYKSSYVRWRTKYLKNSVKRAKYFSNVPGSRASSTGFFFAGQEYEGKFGRSLILHGIEPGINDYACERAVVIHKHLLVSKRRAYVMSSGCPMVAWSKIDKVVNALKGEQSGIKLENPGGLVFIYGPREREWSYGSCPVQ